MKSRLPQRVTRRTLPEAPGTRETLTYTPRLSSELSNFQCDEGKPGLQILTRLDSNPQGPSARHLRAPRVSFSAWKMGRRAGIRPPAEARGVRETRPGCARAGEMLAGPPAGDAGVRASPEQGGGGTARACRPRGGGGAGRRKSRRAPPAGVSSSRHSWSPHRLDAHDPYISVPDSGAGARRPAPTHRRKTRKKRAA